jgi:hypothetical protein
MIDGFWSIADAAAEWVFDAIDKVVEMAANVAGAAALVLGILTGGVLLAHLLPFVAHFGGLILLHLLGTPLWFIHALMFGS